MGAAQSRAPGAAAPKPSANVDGVRRTLRVLESVCELGETSLKDLSQHAALTPPTTLRFLRALEAEGYVRQNEERLWSPTLSIARLAMMCRKHSDLSARIDEALSSIGELCGETVTYAAYSRGSITYLYQSVSNEMVRADTAIGVRRHASRTPSGRLCLAFLSRQDLDEVMVKELGEIQWRGEEGDRFRSELGLLRSQGAYAGCPDFVPDVWTASVPVFDEESAPVGALIVTCPRFREPPDHAELLDMMRDRARHLQA